MIGSPEEAIGGGGGGVTQADSSASVTGNSVNFVRAAYQLHFVIVCIIEELCIFSLFRHGYACIRRTAFIPSQRKRHRTVLQRLRSHQRITAEEWLRICGRCMFL